MPRDPLASTKRRESEQPVERSETAETAEPAKKPRKRPKVFLKERFDPVVTGALVAIAAMAATMYSWDIGEADLQPYYTAALRGMASNWHAFFYGSLDPAGSITLDKLPGAFWLQALSVKTFGLHRWAVALPQVIAATLTVFVLYRVVRTWAGRHAGLLAALVFAVTPITVVLARHSMPDTVLILFLVCAAWAWQRAIQTSAWWTLVVCGLLVGLAFHTKMVQAWLVLPAFGLTYLFGAKASWLKRISQLVVAAVITVASSSVWVLIAKFTPAGQRPFIDATTDNNPLEMVLGYNALSRFDSTAGGDDQANWDLLLHPFGASQIGWLLPFALITLVLALLWTRGRRATWSMWGLWLVVHVVAFGASHKVHVYYTAALTPAIAALTGAGAVLAWRAYRRGVHAWILPTAIALTALWGFKISVHYKDFMSWTMAVSTLAILAAGVLAAAAYLPHTNARLGPPAAAVACVALLITPFGWSLSTLDDSYAGTGSTPGAGAVGQYFRHQARAESPTHTLPIVDFEYASKNNRALLKFLHAHHGRERYLVATERARLAEPLLRLGESVLPMGGFSGAAPYPTAAQMHRLVAKGDVRYAWVVAKPKPTDPKVIGADWVRQNCKLVPQVATAANALYDCHGK